MTPRLLTLRINRRALAGVVLGPDRLEWTDSHHLTSHTDQLVRVTTRVLTSWLALTTPTVVAVDAPPAREGSVTAQVMRVLADLLVTRHAEFWAIQKADVLSAYGLTPLPNRRALRTCVGGYWPECAQLRGAAAAFVVDAAAVALYAECRLSLERPVR